MKFAIAPVRFSRTTVFGSAMRQRQRPRDDVCVLIGRTTG
jgi:predicted nucleotidyltransferase